MTIAAPAVLRRVLRKGWCPGALRPMMARDGLLVRLRITGGILPATVATAIADLAERHGNGLIDLSARANLQLRGVREDSLPALLDGLEALGLLDEDAGAEAIRNVLANPLAGLRPPPRGGKGGPREAWWSGEPPLPPLHTGVANPSTESDARQPPPPPAAVPLPRFAEEDGLDIRGLDIRGLDIRGLVVALEAALVADPALRALAPKFGFLVDDGGAPSLATVAADLRFDWCPDKQAFAVGLGGTAPGALALGLVPAEGLVARAIALAHRALAFPGQPRRIRTLIREHGRDAIAAWFGAEDPGAAPATAAPCIVGQQSLRGIATLGLAAPFGRLDAAMLHAAAGIADQAPCRELRLTPWRVLLIAHITRLDIDAAGFIVDPADPRLRMAACTGIIGCERGTTDTQADATTLAAIAASLPGEGIGLHVSGCAKGCARPRRTAVTLVGRDGRYDLVRDGQPGDPPALLGLDLDGVRRALRAA